jgi:mycothiol synthase
MEPATATQAAYEELLHLDAPISPPDTLLAVGQIRPSPLLIPGTFFIGRETELAQIAERLADPACRLLTIVGPGGIGKTRLALQTGISHKPIFKDGVAWVALNTLQSPEQLAAVIAESLNYRLRGLTSGETELIPLLEDKELLLILDNFEQILPAADFLTRLLEQTLAVKLLVTSRQTLELPQEWRFDLGALPLPDEESCNALVDNSAMQLFVQSGRRADSTFAPTEDDYLAIAHICQLVGGIPLGIELAASWLRVISCTEIAQEIEKSLDFLTVTLSHLPPRHRSLRLVFDYSFGLLTPEEQQILLRLSIFQGSFSREAAEQVAMTGLPQLSALVDRALVQRTAVGRYGLHNVIRQYAAEQLQADPATYAETAQRHSRFYLQWLAEQDGDLRGSRQKEALTVVAAKIANVRAAWKWALARRQPEALYRAAFPLFYFYEVRGLLAEGEAAFRLAAESLQQETEAASPGTQLAICALTIYQAYLGFRQGKVAIAEGLLRSTAGELQTLADETLFSQAMYYLGILEWSLGHFANAIDCLQNSLLLAERQHDEWGAVSAQVYLGLVRHDQGQLAEARRQLRAVQPAVRKLGDPRLLANALLISGRINLLLGYLDDAGRELLQGNGYRVVRHNFRMLAELKAPPPPAIMPEGITIRPFLRDREGRSLIRALREAFRDNWGYVDRGLETEYKRWMHLLDRDPDCDPAPFWFVAVDGEEIAGFTLCHPEMSEDPEMAWVYVVGVRPEWRRRGIALALLQHSFAALYQAGKRKVSLEVDAENPTGATRLYEKAGMHVKRRQEMFEKELRPGE